MPTFREWLGIAFALWLIEFLGILWFIGFFT